MLADLRKRLSQAGADRSTFFADLFRESHTGQLKLFLVAQTLQLRRERRELFRDGTYLPITTAGTQAAHVCAFARTRGEEVVITVVPRLCYSLVKGNAQLPVGQETWRDTHLQLPASLQGKYRNRLTEAQVHISTNSQTAPAPLAQVLQQFPVAVLDRAD